MLIKKGTSMMLFRFRNYKSKPFIEEHLSILSANGFVWMLKLGRRTNISNLEAIKQAGGWLILRAPKTENGKFYLTHFSEFSESEPMDGIYPEYYREILEDDDKDFYDIQPNYQWFKVDSISELSSTESPKFVLSKTGKSVNEVIGSTRTAVMYIKNTEDISF